MYNLDTEVRELARASLRFFRRTYLHSMPKYVTCKIYGDKFSLCACTLLGDGSIRSVVDGKVAIYHAPILNFSKIPAISIPVPRNEIQITILLRALIDFNDGHIIDFPTELYLENYGLV